jgi:hypothetical protein
MTWTEKTELQLDRVYTTILDANGDATISGVGPVTSWERWEINTIHTESGSDKDVTLKVYRNDATNAIAGTYSGNMDTDNTEIELMPAQTLAFKYSGGTPGAHCIITLHGLRVLRGKLAY